MTARLSRHTFESGPTPPVRIVHLGPGAFHRAHQASYTERAGDGWGIAALTQQSRTALEQLGPQDGLYTVLTRGPERDEASVVSAIAEVLDGTGPSATELLARPEVQVVTLTVTEAGYQPGSAALRRLLDGLEARRRTAAAPLTLVSCDNLSSNGAVLRRELLAACAGTELASYLNAACSFPSTVVDRVTPATTPADLAIVEGLLGMEDRAAVVTEPFSQWVLEDDFRAGRPAWERAGARFVGDVVPFERRKLRLLNAGHSLLAYLGAPRGHAFVHQALADEWVHARLVALWAEARRFLDADPDEEALEYCAELERRWSNERLSHRLEQIAADGSFKLRERIVPTLAAARRAGVDAPACVLVLAGWIVHLRADGPLAVRDRAIDRLAGVPGSPVGPAVADALGVLAEDLGRDSALSAQVAGEVDRLEGSGPGSFARR